MTARTQYLRMGETLTLERAYSIVLCIRCERLHIIEVENRTIVRIANWDNSPVLHR
jgi:hypothetical protein